MTDTPQKKKTLSDTFGKSAGLHTEAGYAAELHAAPPKKLWKFFQEAGPEETADFLEELGKKSRKGHDLLMETLKKPWIMDFLNPGYEYYWSTNPARAERAWSLLEIFNPKERTDILSAPGSNFARGAGLQGKNRERMAALVRDAATPEERLKLLKTDYVVQSMTDRGEIFHEGEHTSEALDMVKSYAKSSDRASILSAAGAMQGLLSAPPHGRRIPTDKTEADAREVMDILHGLDQADMVNVLSSDHAVSSLVEAGKQDEVFKMVASLPTSEMRYRSLSGEGTMFSMLSPAFFSRKPMSTIFDSIHNLDRHHQVSLMAQDGVLGQMYLYNGDKEVLGFLRSANADELTQLLSAKGNMEEIAKNLGDDIVRPGHARELAEIMAKLPPEKIEHIFKASGYTPDELIANGGGQAAEEIKRKYEKALSTPSSSATVAPTMDASP